MADLMLVEAGDREYFVPQDVADRIGYLEAQESLLSQWQHKCERAQAEATEVKRPLDEQMARLNANLTAANSQIHRMEVVFGVAMNTLEQIASTPYNRGARKNARATIEFLRTQMASNAHVQGRANDES